MTFLNSLIKIMILLMFILVPVSTAQEITTMLPSENSGNIIWLDGSDLSTMRPKWDRPDPLNIGGSDYVGHIKDKSGQRNDFMQPNDNQRPKYLANVRNGLPALNFKLRNNDALGGLGFVHPAGDFTVVIAYHTIQPERQYIFDVSLGRITMSANDAGAWNQTSSMQTWQGNPITGTDPKIVTWVFKAGEEQARVFENGLLHSTGTYNPIEIGGLPCIGAYFGDQSEANFNGFLFELQMYNYALSDAERQGYEQDLSTKWDIDLE